MTKRRVLVLRNSRMLSAVMKLLRTLELLDAADEPKASNLILLRLIVYEMFNIDVNLESFIVLSFI